MFGLYGDLPSAKDDAEKKAGSWAGSGLMAPSKRTSGLGPPPSVLRAAAGGRGRGREGPGAVAPGRGRGPGPVAPGPGVTSPRAVAAVSSVLASAAVLGAQPSHDAGPAVVAASSGLGMGQDIKDEYDPARPNDYEQVCKDRERQRKWVQGGRRALECWLCGLCGLCEGVGGCDRGSALLVYAGPAPPCSADSRACYGCMRAGVNHTLPLPFCAPQGG